MKSISLSCLLILLSACNFSSSVGPSLEKHNQDLNEYIGRNQEYLDRDLIIVCLDGVQYWYNGGGRGGLLAPKYDSASGEVKRCSGPIPAEGQPSFFQYKP